MLTTLLKLTLALDVTATQVRSQINSNLPRSDPTNSVFPEITLGSYTPKNDDEQNRYNRFGPPYSDDSDEDDDIRNGPQNRNRYDNNRKNNQNYNNNPQNYPNKNFDAKREEFERFNKNPNFSRDNYTFNTNNERDRNNSPRLRNLLKTIDATLTKECFLNVAAQWNFETNVNEVTQLEALVAQQRYTLVQKKVRDQLRGIDEENIYDPQLYRQIQYMTTVGTNALPPDQLDRYNRLLNDMLAIHNSATICAYEQPFQCGLQLNPDLKEIMANSRDWNELQYTWTEWRRKTGNQMKPLFEQVVELTNEAAKFNNFTNAAEYWMFPYESANFRNDIEQVWEEVLPLYELLHSFIRKKLRDFYGPDKISKNAPLPEHIFGSVNGQSWSKILDIVIPYPGRNFLDVTPAMQSQGYNPIVMFEIAEDFFVSMNLSRLGQDFWINSLLEEPVDRPVLCQPSAWDFCNSKDFRIKMCTKVNHADFITVHQQLAHLYYFSNYRNLPKVFRDGANPGFHDAIGNAITLSVASPKHLQKLGLITKSIDDTALDINYLFGLAIDQVVFLPYALALETWRWDIFSQAKRKDQFNCHYWFLRERYGGIKPPILRSELEFDAGSKYHVAANIPYIKYFVGIVLQFQIHRALCAAGKEYVQGDTSRPLHNCDLHGHPEAGEILREMMSKGSSEQWQKTLLETTGETRLDATALREFFKPLEDWLRNENLRNQELVGWTYDGDYCKYSFETQNLQIDGGFYNHAIQPKSHIIGYLANIFIYRICITMYY